MIKAEPVRTPNEGELIYFVWAYNIDTNEGEWKLGRVQRVWNQPEIGDMFEVCSIEGQDCRQCSTFSYGLNWCEVTVLERLADL